MQTTQRQNYLPPVVRDPRNNISAIIENRYGTPERLPTINHNQSYDAGYHSSALPGNPEIHCFSLKLVNLIYSSLIERNSGSLLATKEGQGWV